MSAIRWKKAVSGDWSNAADWSTGKVPGAADDVTLAGTGKYKVTITSAETAHTLTIADANATVADSALFSPGGLLAVTAGTFDLASGGILQGGTLAVGPGGTFVAAGGTLSGTTVAGPLAITGANASLTVAGNLRLTGAGGSGPGTLSVSGVPVIGESCALTFDDATLLDNATVTLAGFGQLQFVNASGTGNETVTLGPNLVLNAVSGGGILLQGNGAFSETLINQGTINDASGLQVFGPGAGGTGTLLNQGSIAVGAGDVFNADGLALFDNTGTVSVQGGTLEVSAYANTGGISVNGGVLALDTNLQAPSAQSSLDGFGSLSLSNGATLNLGDLSVTTAALKAIDITDGATVVSAGSIDNSGQTLVLGAGSAISRLLLYGTLSGGTVQVAGGSALYLHYYPTLADMTYEGVLTDSYADVFLSSGFVLTGLGGTGGGTLNADGGIIQWQAGALLGDATINLNGGLETAELDLNGKSVANADFVLGASATLDASGSGTIQANETGLGTTLDNKGTMNFEGGGIFQIGLSSDQMLLNQGQIIVRAGNELSLDGQMENQGTVQVASGGTLVLSGNLNPLSVLTGSGVLAVRSGGSLILDGGAVTATQLASLHLPSGSTVVLGANLDNTGGTLDVGRLAFNLVLGTYLNPGTISGGTLKDIAGLTVNVANLTGVTVEGTLNVGGQYSQLTVQTALVMTGADGTGSGVLNFTGYDSSLAFAGLTTLGGLTLNDAASFGSLTIGSGTTLDDMTLNFGVAGSPLSTGTDLFFAAPGSANGSVTLGSQFVLQQVGNGTIFSHVVDNGGTIAAGISGDVVYWYGGLDNQASVISSNNSEMFFKSGIINSGTLTAGTFSSILVYTLTNAGLVQASSGATVTIDTLTNVVGKSLSGGSYEVDAGSTIALSGVAGIATLAANLTLSGAGSAMTLAKGVSLDSTLSSIAAAGALTIGAGRGFTATANKGKFSDGGTLTLAGGSFTATALSVLAGGTLTSSGAGSDSVTGTVLNAGNVLAGSGTLQLLGGIINSGTVTAAGALLSVASAVAGAGLLDIGAGGSLDLLGSVAATQSVDFLSGTGLLALAKPVLFAGHINGFAAGDQIDLLNTAANGKTVAAGVLHVTEGKTTVASLAVGTGDTAANFTLGADGHGGTLISFHA